MKKTIHHLRRIILKSIFLTFFLKIIFSIINNIKIKKEGRFYLHYLKNIILINFHPVFNLDTFYEAFKVFTKHYKAKKGDIILDVGSGLGSEMVFFSKIIGSNGKVICIEPDYRLYKVLKKLIKLNKLKNIILYNNFFYKKNNKKTNFRVNPIENWMSNNIFNKKNKFENYLSSSITIDKIMKDNNLKKINYAKFNIEGAEKYLNKGNNFFLNTCENVTISCHDFLKSKNTRTFNNLTTLLKNKNFEIINNDSRHHIYKYIIYAKNRTAK